MSIYFNFKKCRIEFVLQQNNNEHFAVNFLNTHCNTLDFSKIIDEVFSNESFPLEKFTNTSHIVVLPSVSMGYGTLSVPKSLFYTSRDFETKFNALYNKTGNMAYDKFHLYNKDNASTFAFTTYRKDFLANIEQAFKKYNIKVVGFTTYARAVNKFIRQKIPYLDVASFLAVYGDDNLSISANIGNKVLSSMDKRLSVSNLLAKIYVENTLENSIKHNKDNTSYNNASSIKGDERVSLLLLDYENYYKDMGVEFTKVINLSRFNIDNAQTIDFETVDILKAVDKSIILGKKGFFSL